jgi:pimeloyl-ACP methyl ester carboxylesterase
MAETATVEIRHEYAEVNGVRLHYAAAGAGSLILFLHGFPEFWREWREQLVEFGRDHLAVAPDMRGYNLSSRPEGVDQYALPLLVEDVRQLVQTLGYERFTLVAHDWGGGVAWYFALKHPEMLERLVIINMAHPATFGREMTRNPAQQQASQYMLLFRSPEAEATLSADGYAGFYGTVFGGLVATGRFGPEDRAAYIEAWSRPGGLTGGLNYYRAARVGPPAPGSPANGDYAADLPSEVVRVPTLVIWGDADTALLTGNLDGLEEFVPDLRVVRVPGASHWIVHEQPDLVTREIRRFLAARP